MFYIIQIYTYITIFLFYSSNVNIITDIDYMEQLNVCRESVSVNQ